MKGAGKQARDRVFGNLSKRAAAELSEEMDYMGPIDLSEAEEARQKIIAVIKRLEQSEVKE
jgi:flagellar motor switch protein FliG